MFSLRAMEDKKGLPRCHIPWSSGLGLLGF